MDLTDLAFADTSLMVDFAMLARRLRSGAWAMLLRGAQPQVSRLIEMVGLHRLPGVHFDGPDGPGLGGRQPPRVRCPPAGCPSLWRLCSSCCILWPIAELFVAIKVAEAIGVLLTVLLLFVSWPVGMWLVRAEGRARLAPVERRRLRRSPARARGDRRRPGAGRRRAADRPGFITDVHRPAAAGAPDARVARPRIVRNFQSRLVVRAARVSRGGPAPDVDSTATDIDPPLLPR